MKHSRKKITSAILVLALLLPTGQPLLASDTADSVTVTDIAGISRPRSHEVDAVTTKSDFNALLEEVVISVGEAAATVQTVVDGTALSFDLELYASQLGYNSENMVYGVAAEVSEGYRLTKFTIERDAKEFSLLAPTTIWRAAQW